MRGDRYEGGRLITGAFGYRPGSGTHLLGAEQAICLAGMSQALKWRTGGTRHKCS
jgi:hypothetical protein